MRDAEHLIRVAAFAGVGALLFFVVRGVLVPRTFGQYGHYRGAAIAEIAAMPVVHAGQDICAICHSEVLAQKAAGKHAGVHCEACHGPQSKHTMDPGGTVPPRPDSAVLCARCHEADAAKPKGFPQVKTAEHSAGLPCVTCHQAHAPSLGDAK